MKNIHLKSNKIRVILLGICAVLTGLVNGFLGTGGGIVLVFALGLLKDTNDASDSESTVSEPSVCKPSVHKPMISDSSVRDRFATVIAVIIPLSLVSAFTYGKSVNFEMSAPYIVPGMLGGLSGALLLDKIRIDWLKKLFALMVIWAGICFIK